MRVTSSSASQTPNHRRRVYMALMTATIASSYRYNAVRIPISIDCAAKRYNEPNERPRIGAVFPTIFAIPWISYGLPSALIGAVLYLLVLSIYARHRRETVVVFLDLQDWKQQARYVLGAALWGYAAEHILQSDQVQCFFGGIVWYYAVLSIVEGSRALWREMRRLRDPKNIVAFFRWVADALEKTKQIPTTEDGDSEKGSTHDAEEEDCGGDE